MNKFSKGDHVRYVGYILKSRIGRVGTVSDFRSGFPIVTFDTDGASIDVFEESLEHVFAASGRLRKNVLPTDAAARNAIPMADGLLFYFPNALAEVSKVSKVGNEQHNKGESMHWARDKSTDHANKIIKHLVDAGGFDTDGQRHTANVAWRALALLEDELIAAGAVPGRNAIGAPAVVTNKPQPPVDAYERRMASTPRNCIEDEI